mgnify:CR=1 FL=1
MHPQRLIDQPTKAWLKRHSPQRLPQLACPNPLECSVVSYTLGENGGGVCCGLLTQKDDLDIIRLCILSQHLDGKLEAQWANCTPNEVASIIRSLSVAIDETLWLVKEYRGIYSKMGRRTQQRRRRYQKRVTEKTDSANP